MTQPRYDLYFKGDLIDGFFIDFVKADLQNLLKADSSNIDRLFSGIERAIKKDVDKATAIKFQQAFKKAGAKLIVRPHGAVTPTAQAKPAQASMSTQSTPTSNSTVEFTTTLNPVVGESDAALAEHHQPELNAPAAMPAWSISEPGALLVEPNRIPTPNIDFSGLSVAETGADLLIEKAYEPIPPVLNLDGFSLAEPGAKLDTLKDDVAPIQVDISHLSVD